ncbi:MAG: insulinase family protein [Labilithrix sp.]|nr:insulinase family protein [Labilithrix sp.]
MRRGRWLLPLVLALGCAPGARKDGERPDAVVGRVRAPPQVFGRAPEDASWLRAPPPPLAPRPLAEPPVVERRLSNGVRVLVSERREFPSVGLAFALDRGVCDGGAAATLYALGLGGSPGRTRSDNFGYLYRLGVDHHVRVTDDAVIVGASAFPPLLASAISRLAPLFFAPALAPEDVARARARWNARLTSEPRSVRLADRALRTALFGDGGYGSTLVDPSDVAAEPDVRVREFYRAALSPRHVSVVVVGDTTADVAVALLERYTKGLPRAEVPTSGCAALPAPPISDAVRIVDEPGAAQSKVRIGFAGVPAGHADGPALDVLSAALGSSLSSRLNLKIRSEHGLTYGVTMTSSPLRSHGLVDVAASVETERTAEALRGILAELERAAAVPLEASELAHARGNALVGPGTHLDAAEELAQAAAYGLPANAGALRSRAIASVTAEALRALAGRYLAPQRRVITVVGDASRISGPLRELGIGDVVVLPR